MSAEHIPFVFGPDDCRLLKKYSDSSIIRVSNLTRNKIKSALPSGARIWCDGAIDGLDKGLVGSDQAYMDYVKRFPGYDQIGNPDFHKNPKKELIKIFVQNVMDDCGSGQQEPEWLSVPQLPITRGSSRNKINRLLAQAAGEWKAERKYSGKLILPAILAHQDLVKKKTQRNAPVSLVQGCYEAARAQGVWVAESSLNDQEVSGSHGKRFQGLIDFHEELNKRLPSDAVKIAGPYWGLNLVLWVRGLIDYPAVGLGSPYRYYIPGGRRSRGKAHVAIPSLKRWVVASPQFESWVKKEALPSIPPQEDAYAELDNLLRNYDRIRLSWKTQVAEFYKGWFNQIAAVPRSGRALALYQQLSSAYVLGKSLPELPKEDEGTARKPEKVAQQLMLICL